MYKSRLFNFCLISFFLTPLYAGHFDSKEKPPAALEEDISDDTEGRELGQLQKMDEDSLMGSDGHKEIVCQVSESTSQSSNSAVLPVVRQSQMLAFEQVPWEVWQLVASFLKMHECFFLSETCFDAQKSHKRARLSPATLTVPAKVSLRELALCDQERWTYLRTLDIWRLHPHEPETWDLLPLERLEDLHWLPAAVSQEATPSALSAEHWASATDVIRKHHGALFIAPQGDEQGMLEIERAQFGPYYAAKWTVVLPPHKSGDAKCCGTMLSPIFQFRGHEWRLFVFPHGNPRYVFDKSAMSVYIENRTVGHHKNLPFSCKFKVTAEVLKEDFNGESINIEVTKESSRYFTFGWWMNPGPYDRGWHRLVDLNSLGAAKDAPVTWQITAGLRPAREQK